MAYEHARVLAAHGPLCGRRTCSRTWMGERPGPLESLVVTPASPDPLVLAGPPGGMTGHTGFKGSPALLLAHAHGGACRRR